MSQAPPGDGSGCASELYWSCSHMCISGAGPLWCEDDDLEDIEPRLEEEETDELLDFDEVEDLDLSLKWVSRCCFMLSARVNFL